MIEKHKNGRPRAKTPEDYMLVEFLRAKTPHEKREVIKSFNPFYFTLTPSKAELARRKAKAHEDNTCETNPTNLQGQGENHESV